MRVDAVRTERESALESLAPGPPAGVLITSSRGGAGTGAAQHRRPWPSGRAPGQAGRHLGCALVEWFHECFVSLSVISRSEGLIEIITYVSVEKQTCTRVVITGKPGNVSYPRTAPPAAPAPPAAHPPSWPHRLHGAPAPSALPTDAAARRNGQTCRAGFTKAYPAVYDCIDREKAGDSLLKLLGEGVNHTNTKRPGSKVCTRLGLRYTTIQLLPCYATRRSTPPTSPAAPG